MKEWLIAFKQVLLHPFNILNAFFDNDAHKIVSKRGLKLLNKNHSMTPKEKAEELYCKYDSLFKAPFKKHQQIKECALIAVDEILNTIEYSSQADELSKISYWENVKREINNL